MVRSVLGLGSALCPPLLYTYKWHWQPDPQVLDSPTANEVADRDMRWYLDEHVDVLFGQNAGDDLDSQFLADLPDNRSYPLPQRAFQNLIAVFGDPDDVVAMVKNGVTSGCIAHRLTP